MSEQTHSAIEFHDVTMAYDDRVILDDVSFVVNPGETKIVMGGSGTGKSTILKLVLGLIKPQGGRILIDGDVDSTTTPGPSSGVSAAGLISSSRFASVRS